MGLRIIHVLRKPFRGSVAQNVLEHGTGGLNVDGCRVATGETRAVMEYFYKGEKGKQPTGQVYQGRADGTLADGSRKIGETMKGRWPSNVILEHLPECRLVGTRKVRGSFTEGGGSRPGGFGNVGAPKGGSVPVGHGYADEDGLETVDEWSCAPGCPVADCDGESGPLRDRGNITPTTGGRGTGHSWATSLYISEHGSYDEGGGASRFFKQVGGDRGSIDD